MERKPERWSASLLCPMMSCPTTTYMSLACRGLSLVRLYLGLRGQKHILQANFATDAPHIPSTAKANLGLKCFHHTKVNG